MDEIVAMISHKETVLIISKQGRIWQLEIGITFGGIVIREITKVQVNG